MQHPNPIETALAQIEASIPNGNGDRGKCPCKACQDKLALVKALRRALYEVRMLDKAYVAPSVPGKFEADIAAILTQMKDQPQSL